MKSALTQDWIGNREGASPLWDEQMRWYGPVGVGLATSKKSYEKFFFGWIINRLAGYCTSCSYIDNKPKHFKSLRNYA